jgi:two-component system, NarL family, nitrate/nitrite response regulator NarL
VLRGASLPIWPQNADPHKSFPSGCLQSVANVRPADVLRFGAAKVVVSLYGKCCTLVVGRTLILQLKYMFYAALKPHEDGRFGLYQARSHLTKVTNDSLNFNLASLHYRSSQSMNCTHYSRASSTMLDNATHVQGTQTSVLIVDDHLLVSETLSASLVAEGSCELDIAVDLKAAAAKIAENGRYDVVLLDYQLPGVLGLQGLRQLVEANGGGVALFSGVAGWSIVQAAMEHGASGFIPKTVPIKTLIHAIKFIADGEVYLPSDYLRRFSGGESPELGLKPREMRVLAHLCEGLQNKEIGREVGIDEVIVKMDVKSICRKLGVRNRTEAALAARRLGLL